MPYSRHLLLLMSACALLSGCFGTRAKPDVEALVTLPERFATPEQTDSSMQQVPLDRWCSDFGQSELERLVELAFQNNLNLMASWARLEQSAALLAQTNANRMPQIGADIQTSRSKSPAFGGQNLPGLPTSFTNNFYRIEGNVAYEIDLWGKLAAQRQAAELDYRASRADVEAAALSLTSSVAEAWFDILAQRQKYELLQAQIDLNERYVELLGMRFQQGLSSVLDINQQRQQIQALRGQQRTATQLRVLAAQRLAILVGASPLDAQALFEVAESRLPELTSLPDAGIPADLLERRPDLRAASIRLEAANARIAVAVRDRLPTLRLSASTFLQALDIKNLVNDVFWTVAGAVSAPLVDGGRRRAEVVRAEAAQKEVYYSYGDTLLTALNEVQGAIVSEYYQAEFIQDLKSQREIADVSLTLSRERYQRGNFDFLRVLTSLQSLQQIEQSIIDAERRQLSNRLQLCRALGGTWTQSLTPSSPSSK